jgi:SAM-dependent methyltransferase
MTALAHRASQIAEVIRRRHPAGISNMLVVGCGEGREAHALANALGCKVTGIDLRDDFDPEAAAGARLMRADATALPFATDEFDFIYSYHVLEHIPRYRDALAEMNRVLKKGGGLWIGTPNRSRMIGYVGSKVSMQKFIAWNAADWSARLRGKFRNELGAHAGFTLRELGGELRSVFSRMDDATLDYYLAIYPNRARTVRLLQNSGLGTLAFPSIYFVGQKN